MLSVSISSACISKKMPTSLYKTKQEITAWVAQVRGNICTDYKSSIQLVAAGADDEVHQAVMHTICLSAYDLKLGNREV